MIHPWVTRVGRTRLFLALAPRLLPRLDVAGHRLTGGRLLPSRLLLPTVLLTTTGHRTGRPHTTPLCAHKYADGNWLIAATNFGRPHHPAWSTNLLHHPRGTVTHRDHQCAVEATLLPRASTVPSARSSCASFRSTTTTPAVPHTTSASSG